jgi:hypothetical protein
LASLYPAQRLPLRQAAMGDARGHGAQPRSSCRTAAQTVLRPAPASAVTPPTRASAVGAPLATGEESRCNCRGVWVEFMESGALPWRRELNGDKTLTQ